VGAGDGETQSGAKEYWNVDFENSQDRAIFLESHSVVTDKYDQRFSSNTRLIDKVENFS
jgi:hypothetical protein